MIVVSVHLYSARTDEITELARLDICNIGGSDTRGNYNTRSYIGRSKKDLDKRRINREGNIIGHPRKKAHVWNLVAKALISMGYGV